MWSKLTHALKHHTAKEEPSSSQGGEVLSKVYEQHPNLSVFHANEAGALPTGSPNSPSLHGKRSMYKRMSKAALRDEAELPRAPSPSPFNLPTNLPKKVRNALNSNSQANSSQLSLNATPPEKSKSQEVLRRSSFDMLRPSPPRASQDTTRSVKDTRRRPSLDMLRQESSPPSQGSLRRNVPGTGELDVPPTTHDNNFSSVRSILRDPHTPGTGQNVRFFSRDAFKVITPDQSLSLDVSNKPQPALPHEHEQSTFLDRLSQPSPPGASTPPSLKRSSPSSKISRPTVAEIFSPLNSQDNSVAIQENSDMSLSLSNPMNPGPGRESSNLFDVSQQLDMSSFPPPGLEFDVNAPMFSLDSSANDEHPLANDANNGYPNQMTSTPYKPKDLKGKGKEMDFFEDMTDKEDLQLVTNPTVVDETIFHAKERSPKFAAPLHERSQSFSFGQTVFYSMANTTNASGQSSPDGSMAYPSSDLKPSLLDSSGSHSAVPTPPSAKSRSRAMSDTVFQTMLRSGPTSKREPEADINDESSSGLVVYSGGPAEPDPFSAHANTYYTPQTMIPATPPRGALKHTRKTSKEESLIISLQTQLTLRNELCSHYEADLKARDELVEILGKKLADMEKDESKRKNALRSWKKKVQELERACRQLEEAVEDSRQESMERSVMDEASGEAMRMLHRQIASLQREKNDWSRREEGLREEVETLEGLVRDRSEDVMNLKESLWSRDENDRELQQGIREAKEQMEQMGNISIGMVDEEELKKLMMERDQKNVAEKERHRAVEFELQQEVEELQTKYENLQVQKAGCEEQLEQVNSQLKIRDEEYATLKAELEAQWEHTAKASELMETLEKDKSELSKERDSLKVDIEELEGRMSNMEVEWNESENKKNDLEAELQEVWNLKDALEKERDQLEDNLHQEREHVDQLEHDLQERDDRVSELEQERQFANENVARLEEIIRQRDEEISQQTQRIMSQETDLEGLREEMSTLKREHSHLVNEQTRALRDAAGQEDQNNARMDQLIRSKAEADVEIKTSKDRVTVLKEEVERLRRQVHTLQQESADKEVKIVQITKQRAQDKEDLQGMNIALDSKQQELELLKRKNGVKGTAGSTPAQPSKVAHRRDSSIFSATPLSRPSSVLSDTGTDIMQNPNLPSMRKERKPSETPTTSSVRPPALGKSTRINGIGSTSFSASKTVTRAGVDGSMGPPPLKTRPSVGTPTPSGRASALSRSSSTRPSPSATPVPHRRVSSATSEQILVKTKVPRTPVPASPVTSVAEEKENVDDSSTTARRRSMVPSLA